MNLLKRPVIEKPLDHSDPDYDVAYAVAYYATSGGALDPHLPDTLDTDRFIHAYQDASGKLINEKGISIDRVSADGVIVEGDVRYIRPHLIDPRVLARIAASLRAPSRRKN